MLRPGLLGSRTDFVKRYCQGYFDRKSRMLKDRGCNHSTELHLILTKFVMIRHLKSDIMSQLPQKIRNVVQYNQRNDRSNNDESHRQIVDSKIVGDTDPFELLQIYQRSAQLKLEPASLLISRLLGDPDIGTFIVFAHHFIMMDGIQALLNQNNCSYIRVDGTSSTSSRFKSFNDFLQGNVRVALLSISSCSTGLNLASVSNVIVFAELTWTPALLLQVSGYLNFATS